MPFQKGHKLSTGSKRDEPVERYRKSAKRKMWKQIDKECETEEGASEWGKIFASKLMPTEVETAVGGTIKILIAKEVADKYETNEVPSGDSEGQEQI